MGDEVWTTLSFDQAVLVNPSVRLERGEIYPFVDMQAVDPGSRCVDPSELREFKGGGSRFINGDTLLARITPCLENGKIARYVAPKGEKVGHGSTEFIVIRGRPNVTDSGFAYYLTKWDGVRQYCISQMTGSSGRQRVPTSALSHCEVTIPPLKEQRAIAHILGTLDDKIELNRKMNETLEAMARALFKSWFVDFDPVRAKAEGRDTGLPKEIADFFPDEFEDSELGKIPKGWKIGPLSAVGRITKCAVNPGDSPTKIWEHYSIPAFDASRLALRETGDSIKSGKYRVPSTCVLVSKLNPQFPRVWLPSVQNQQSAICSTEFVPFLPQKTEWRSYLYELVTSDLVQSGIEQRVTGSTGSRQRVKPDDMASIPVVQPFSRVIDQFCLISRPLHEKLSGLLDESHTLSTLRDVLLPKLISGELRVPEAERLVEQEAFV